MCDFVEAGAGELDARSITGDDLLRPPEEIDENPKELGTLGTEEALGVHIMLLALARFLTVAFCTIAISCFSAYFASVTKEIILVLIIRQISRTNINKTYQLSGSCPSLSS